MLPEDDFKTKSHMTFYNLILIAILIVGSTGCATFTSQIPASSSSEARLGLAGQTLTCAAASQQTSILLALASSASVGAASGALVLSPDQNGAFIALGFAALSAATGWISLANLWTATQYTQRAGEVAAGQANLGGCQGSQPINTQAMKGSTESKPPSTRRSTTSSPPKTYEECRAVGGQWVPFANECKVEK